MRVLGGWAREGKGGLVRVFRGLVRDRVEYGIVFR